MEFVESIIPRYPAGWDLTGVTVCFMPLTISKKIYQFAVELIKSATPMFAV